MAVDGAAPWRFARPAQYGEAVIAVLKIDAEDLPVAKIADSTQIKVGDIVFAIGNPMGVGLTVTSGIISATGRSLGKLSSGCCCSSGFNIPHPNPSSPASGIVA